MLFRRLLEILRKVLAKRMMMNAVKEITRAMIQRSFHLHRMSLELLSDGLITRSTGSGRRIIQANKPATKVRCYGMMTCNIFDVSMSSAVF